MADRRLLHQFFTAHAGQMVDYLRRRMGGRSADAQDVSQEVFLRMLRVEDLSSIRDPQGYLFTVANNLRRERLYTKGPRRDWVRVSLDDAMQLEPAMEVELNVDLEVDLSKQLSFLSTAVERLSERDRLILTMRFRDGLTYSQIAHQFGWSSKSAAEKALAVAIEHCRAQMDRLGAI